MSPLFVALICIVFATQSQYVKYNMMTSPKSSNSNDSLGICYGEDQDWKDNPYVVAIRNPADASDISCCTGSIISLNPGIIMTAAKCLDSTVCGGGNAVVRIGCDDPSDCHGDIYQISAKIIHGNYQVPLQFSNNIGLIRLVNGITTKKAQNVEIPPVDASGFELKMVGYGTTVNEIFPDQVQAASTNFVDRVTCNDIWESLIPPGPWIDNTMICIQDTVNTITPSTTCSGDSGAPITKKRECIDEKVKCFSKRTKQYGFGSVAIATDPGSSCIADCRCCGQYPQIGTNVPYFNSWIKLYIKAWKEGDFNYTFSGDKHYFYNK